MQLISLSQGIGRKFNPFFYAFPFNEIGCLNFTSGRHVQMFHSTYFC